MNNRVHCNVTDCFTGHAALRSVQRGIDRDLADLAIKFGEEYHAGNGDMVYWLNRRSSRRFRVSEIYSDGAVNVAVVISSNGRVITVMHCSGRSRHWKRAA